MSASALGDKSGKKPRMPASSLRICGQPWLLGAEDLCFPATLALIWDVVMFAVALSAKLLDDSHGMPPTCSSDLDHQLYLALLLQVIVWSCITLCDISLLTSALRTKMFTRNYSIVKIVYTRLLLTVADFIITLLTAIWLSSAVRTQCLNLDETTRVVDDLSLTIIAGGFMHVLAASIFICISFAMGGPTSQRTWRKRLSCIFCCCFSQDSNADGEQDVIGSIARIFTEFFHVEGQHVVPSDIIVGFALVEGAQRKRQKAGDRFLFSEPPNRWETVSEEKKTSSGSVQLQDKPADSKQIDVKIDTPGSNPHEPADACLAGRQPSLMRQDWQRIADAKHYAKYSIGAYGWMMYAFENISCVFKCSVCDCGCGAPLPQQHDGSGCCAGQCCHWDINSFLKTSGIPKQDLLYCHLVSKVGSPVYWVCVDREKKSLVVAIRGTLSVADAITDMNARATPMDEYGYPGSYTHLGILNNAKALRAHLKEKGVVSKFLQANPDYNLVIVGHSLGAGTTGLLTIIMKDDFPGTKLKSFCLAPPLLLDPVLATSAWVRETITTIVYDYDIISHLSLGNLFKLKLQMGKLFEFAADSKWKILRAQWNQRYSGMFEPGNHDFKVVKATDSKSPRGAQGNSEAEERLLQEEAGAQQALISKQPSSGDVKSDNVKAVEVHDFQMDLRPQYLPGRIYHVIPEHRIRDKQPCCACCCGPKRRTFIYPAAQETFQEVVISSQMFKNHLPPAYALNHIDIPDLEVCRKG